MLVQERPLASIKPYANNPRRNDDGVDAVAASIREFGFRQPSIGRSSRPARADCSRVGWTSGITRDMEARVPGGTAPPAAETPIGVRRWVGRKVYLSCDSCLL